MAGFRPSLPGFTGSLRCEIVMFNKEFPKVVEGYKKAGEKIPANPRNAASGIARRHNGKFSEFLSLIYFDVEEDIDFKTEMEKITRLELLVEKKYMITYLLVSDYLLIEDIYIQYIDKVRDTLHYDIDGLVIRINDLEIQSDLGIVGGRPKGQIALKFPPKKISTTYLGTKWNVSRTGRVNPIADLEPVLLDGSKVRHASLANLDIMHGLRLTAGCGVQIHKAGDIIPQIVRKDDDMVGPVPEAPTHCPDCGSELERDSCFLWCRNPECPTQVLEKMIHYVSTIGIDGIAGSFLKSLLENKRITTLPDLYQLAPADLRGLSRIGESLIDRYFKEIERTKKMSVAKFLQSLAIENLGNFASEALVEKFSSMELIRKASFNELVAIKGFGETLAEDIIAGFKDMADIIDELLIYIELEKKKEGVFSGMKICMTGSFKVPREKVYKPKIVDAGGKWASSVSKDTTYLVTNDQSTNTGKLKKARELSVKIINEEEFLKLLEG